MAVSAALSPPFLLQAALDDGKKRELQGVIQSYFKDWLMTSGNMRQVLSRPHPMRTACLEVQS